MTKKNKTVFFSCQHRAGHRSAAGLALSCRRNFVQRDDDAFYMRFPDGPLVAGRNLDKVRCPVLVLVGDRDKQFLKASEMMAAKIPGAQLAKLQDAGHMAVEKEPAKFDAAVVPFLSSLDHAAPARARL